MTVGQQARRKSHFRVSVLPREARPPKAPVRMQPVNCERQEPVQLASKFAGQLTVTHWKKASLQVFATVQMPGPFCANASTHRTATATTTARMIEARLSKGTISERLSQHRNAPMLST